MPKIRALLDSSPIQPPPHKPEKPDGGESLHEKPSLKALPTPPRTRSSHKRKRSRRTSRVTDSDSDDEHLPSTKLTQPPPESSTATHTDKHALVLGHKKRRMFQLDVIAEELSNRAAEDEFWTGTSSATIPPPTTSPVPTRARTQSRSPTRSPSSSPPARKLRRSNTGLFSPPPSKRHTSIVPTRLVTPPPRPPVTPPRRLRQTPVRRKLFPERDSPDNPFLAKDDDDSLSPADLTPEPHTPLRHVEKPTITYVFRGVKGVFENPLYDPSQPDGVRQPSPGSPSQLPPSDPDFSPTPYCPPKLLFPEARARDHARRLRSRKEVTPSPEGPLPPVGESSKANPPSKASNAKGKQVRPQRKSEWDTSDEEDAPQHERQRPGFTREEPRAKAPVTRSADVLTKKVEAAPPETVEQRPKRALRRSTRRDPTKQ